MKKLSCLILGLAVLATGPAFAQPPANPATSPAAPARTLTKFNLDFPGGTPKQLATAIQKSTGRPLNVIVPDELANWKLPSLKMNGVDVAELFMALEQAGRSSVVVDSGGGSYQRFDSRCGFKTPARPGAESDDTVWYFYVDGPAATPKVSRFYHLAPYLAGGLTVDDITTAIQSAWTMRGEAAPPALSFHKETKLLIAVGNYGGLDVIDQVLKALEAVKTKPVEERKTKQ